MIAWIIARFGAPLLFKVLGGGLIISLLAGGIIWAKYNWWDKPGYEKEIRELQEVSIKYQAQIYRLEAEKQDQRVVIKYREKKSHESNKVDAAAAAGDDAGMDDIFVNLGMLPPRPAGPPPTGASGPGH